MESAIVMQSKVSSSIWLARANVPLEIRKRRRKKDEEYAYAINPLIRLVHRSETLQSAVFQEWLPIVYVEIRVQAEYSQTHASFFPPK